MRKGMWFVAAIMIVAVVGSPVGAADAPVKMVEGSPSDASTWRFSPEEITIPVGSSVTWRNDGSLEHDARTDTQEFAPLLSQGESHTFTFKTPGRYEYYCEPHRTLGMTGVITVTGGASTPTTGATTTTTAAPAGGATTTTAKGAESTTTTTRAGAGDAGSTTTTAGSGGTSTTQASATVPTSATGTGDVTTTTGAGAHGEEAAAADSHGGGGGSEKKTNAVAVGLAGILTAALAAVSLKLLTGKP